MKSRHLIESFTARSLQLLTDPRVWAILAALALLGLAAIDEALQPGFQAPLVTP